MASYMVNLPELRKLAESSFDEVSFDGVMTYLHAHRVFSWMNRIEFLTQIRTWQNQGLTIHPKNVFPIKVNGEDSFLFVVQHPSKENLCPLALAFGIMCSGYSYISRDKRNIDIVLHCMGTEEKIHFENGTN